MFLDKSKVIEPDLGPNEEINSELATESKPVEPEKPVEVKIPVSIAVRNGRVNRMVNFRSEANSTSDIIDVLIPNTKVKIVSSVKEYYQVTYNGKPGFILKNAIDEVR